MAKSVDRFNIAIAGSGYVGLSLALALKQSAPHLSVVVIDPAPAGHFKNDPRASAIAAAAARMLKQLEVWDKLLPKSQPINEMIITDSKLSDPIRPVFLTFGGEANPCEPFAHMVPNKDMLAALHERAVSLGVEFMPLHFVKDFKREGALTNLHLSQAKTAKKSTINCQLLVACDGVRSKLRDLAGIKTLHWSYDQMGIVVTVAHERDHNGCAYEHFLPAGPFATLPLVGNKSSIVWTESTQTAKQLLALDEFEFELELAQRFGRHLGELSLVGSRNAYPLGLTLPRDIVRDGLALAGDAAHGIHPIAGQGLNLGFKDAAALAQTIVEADRMGLDFSSLATLEHYQKWRRFDIVQMGITTDVLNRLFSNDNQLLGMARDLGLGLVNKMPGLKDFFIGQASSTHSNFIDRIGGENPRLLSGEAI